MVNINKYESSSRKIISKIFVKCVRKKAVLFCKISCKTSNLQQFYKGHPLATTVVNLQGIFESLVSAFNATVSLGLLRSSQALLTQRYVSL